MAGRRIRPENLRLRVEARAPSTPGEEAALEEALSLWRRSRRAAVAPRAAAGRGAEEGGGPGRRPAGDAAAR